MKIWKIVVGGALPWTVYMAFSDYPSREQIIERLQTKFPALGGGVQRRLPVGSMTSDRIRDGQYTCDEIEVLGLPEWAGR